MKTPTNLHTTVNFDKYVDRMSHVTDKNMVLQLVNSGEKVLDFGCGDGTLSEYCDPDLYTGYDLSPDMVARAREQHPNHRFTTTRPTDNHDVVLFSSILHEVYSYNGFNLGAVQEVLDEVREVLPVGGGVVIRDGVIPDGSIVHGVGDDWGTTARHEFPLKNPDDASSFLHFINDGPQEFGVKIESGNLVGTLEECVHFLNVYTWGWDSSPRERCERVNFMNLDGWFGLVHAAGYEVATINVITQPDYFQHLSQLVELGGVSWGTKVLLRLSRLW